MTKTRREAKITTRLLRNGRIALYCRGRKLMDCRDWDSVRAFMQGYRPGHPLASR